MIAEVASRIQKLVGSSKYKLPCLLTQVEALQSLNSRFKSITALVSGSSRIAWLLGDRYFHTWTSLHICSQIPNILKPIVSFYNFLKKIRQIKK
jgi:hypothetical protein